MGTPVIAYGTGGARETVVQNKTGIFFEEQTVDSIINSVIEFEKIEDKFDPVQIAEHSKNFSSEVFRNKLNDFVNKSYKEFKGR